IELNHLRDDDDIHFHAGAPQLLLLVAGDNHPLPEVAAMSNSVQKAPTRTVVILSFSGVQLIDIAGPAQAFTTANDEEGRPIYSVKLMALGPNSGQTASGLVLLPSNADSSKPIDTVLLPGG